MKTFRIVGLTLLAMILCLSACSGGGDEPIEPTPKPEVIKSEITIDSSILSNGLTFTSEKGEKSVSFSTNENWTLSVAGTTNGSTWCTPSATSGSKGNASVKFSVAENTSYENRSVSVTIKSGSATKTFVVLQEGAEKAIPYVAFIADAEQTLRMSKAVETLEYSVNDGEWKELGTTQVTFGGNNGSLRIRGKSIKGTAINSGDYSNVIFGNNVTVSCKGDIRTLIDYKNYDNVETDKAKFCGLFYNCRVLTSAPELPAVDLASSCYREMFSYCSSLVSAPELPAKDLTVNCYEHMFYECNSLTTVPELPATTLVNDCYKGMFYGCSSMTTAPALPATTLVASCYREMFYGCRSLTTAPVLPATILGSHCYYKMFYGCSSLTTAPELPAENLVDGCYNGMFRGCSSLTTAPVLPAKNLVSSCYYKMFNECTKLNNVTMLATDISATDCLQSWLRDVASIGTFIKAEEMESLPNGPDGIPSGWTVQNKE